MVTKAPELPELIEKMNEAVQSTERWPDSMKKMHDLRLKADAYFTQRKREQENLTAPTYRKPR